MSNEFIRPEELDDDRLLYWGRHHAKRFKQLHYLAEKAQQTHESFLAEIMKRDLLKEFMENLRNGKL